MYNTDLPRRADLPSSSQLLRSTAIAATVAIGLLVTVILPAEYGIDVTGIGRVLDLTQMGQIKTALTSKSAKEAPAVEKPISAAKEPPALPQATAVPDAPAKSGSAAGQTHTTTVKLKPGQAAEIKLAMSKGATVQFEWRTEGGPVNYDTHGDPVNAQKNFYHGYGKGRNSEGEKGTLEAAFDGTHGWFWRNRSGGEVTVTLKTNGDYTQIKRVL